MATMRPVASAVLVTLCSAAFACGDSSGMSSGSATAVTTATTPGTTGTTADEPTTGGSGTAGSDSAPTTAATEGGPKLDVGSPGGNMGACGCEFNYVWVANSSEGTVSKINMETLEEEARYLTRADGMGNPSRTSVSLKGDVAVANRHGGLVKFYADINDCKDTNGVPGIQTSTGKSDVLDWDMEECRAWYVDFPTTNQRPVAWTQGTIQSGTCNTTGEKVWTVMSETPSLFPGQGGAGGVIVALVDGETGNVDKTITIPTFPGDGFGAYGGAVNLEGDLFFTPLGLLGDAKMVRVYHNNFAYKVFAVPTEIGPYGITVDHKGKVWVASNRPGGAGVGRFDPVTETWDLVNGFYSGAGLAEGPDNLMWVASGGGANSVDIDTLQLGPVFPSQYYLKGLSFDADGFMWAVNYAETDDAGNPIEPELVMKIDVSSLSVVGQYDGLDRPYTYSDFTGNALFNVTCMAPE